MFGCGLGFVNDIVELVSTAASTGETKGEEETDPRWELILR